MSHPAGCCLAKLYILAHRLNGHGEVLPLQVLRLLIYGLSLVCLIFIWLYQRELKRNIYQFAWMKRYSH